MSLVSSSSGSSPTSSRSVMSSSSFAAVSSSPLPSLFPHVVRDWESKLVVNLSNASLDPLSFNFFKRGLNFVVAPRTIPHNGFLIEIDNAIRSLPSAVVEEVRKDCVVILRRATPPTRNIPKAKIHAYKNLIMT
ncbi:hypothetical protein SUGI_0543190 [Cryptomeria japonica]|nr:hypothetical protein SUGI_0543190 [Cryptomeria japonica]